MKNNMAGNCQIVFLFKTMFVKNKLQFYYFIQTDYHKTSIGISFKSHFLTAVNCHSGCSQHLQWRYSTDIRCHLGNSQYQNL